MSSWCKISNYIALFSASMYTCLLLYNIAVIVNYHNINAEPKTDLDWDALTDESRVWLENSNATKVYTAEEELNVYIIMLILSVLLMWGVKVKNHQIMAPWLLMGGLVVVFGFCASTISSGPKYILDFTVLGLQAVIWCPVYTCYQELRHSYYFKPTISIRPNAAGQPRKSRQNQPTPPTTNYKNSTTVRL